MANGPPTPPPTTATEFIDEARESAPATEPTVGTPVLPQAQSRSPPQDAYRFAFPTIASLAGGGSFRELIQAAEEFDLNVRSLNSF
jgi:COP9 signalosome complex subunit 8